jgi:phage terminase large subunit
MIDQQILNETREALSKAEFPEKLAFLFEPSRYKCAYGGRGSGKSWGFARALLIRAYQKPLRILCTREVQKSIKQSVHQLLSDQIQMLGLGKFYEVLDSEIRGLNGSGFSFAGLKGNTVESIKSFEGVDIVWIEEAQSVSERSLQILFPTIRKENSEIWLTFNPELETDPVFQRFVHNEPTDAKVVKINWNDNPWFTKELDAERLNDKARDIEAYNTIWEGLCRRTVDGAIFAKEVQLAELEERFTRVPYDATKPVHIVFDLGWSDATAWWVIQFVGMENRILRYEEANQTTISEIMAKIQNYGYLIDTLWLPHDAENKTLAGNGRSIEEIVRGAGYKTRILPRVPIVDSINAARTIFRNCYFDRVNCEQGIQCLRHYRYEVDPDTGVFSKTPLHDQYSHGADAFRYIGLMINEPKKVVPKKPQIAVNSSWMG